MALAIALASDEARAAVDEALASDGPHRESCSSRAARAASPASASSPSSTASRPMLPGGGRGVTIRALHRAELGRAERGPGGALRIEVDRAPRLRRRSAERAHELAREYRAVIEEILEARGDPRHRRVPALDRPPRRARRHGGLLPRPVARAQARAARDARRRGAAREGDRLGARRARRDRAAPAHPRRRRRGHGEVAARVRAAPPARRHPQGARRDGRRRTRSSATASASPRRRCPTRPARRPSASVSRLEAAGASNPEASTIRTYLDWLLSVPWGVSSEEQHDVQRGARRARGRPRRPGGGQGAHPRVPRGAQVPPRARDRGRAQRRDPRAGRAARRRQDVARRVDRPRARTASSCA